MSDANQLKTFLETLGLSAFENLLPPDLAKQLEEDIAELGGAEAVLTGNVPPPPPPKPHAALGFPDPPIATGELVYACTDEHNGALRKVAPVETTTRADTLDGVPVWRFTWKVNDHGLDIEFEECARAADLRLIRYEGGAVFFHSKAFVAGDQVYVQMEYAGGKRHVESKKTKLPETAFTTVYALWASLAAAPLDRGWTALVHVDRKVDKRNWRYIPTRLEVVGEERITTPAGTFDCWIVGARGASGEPEMNDRYWVSRGEPSERVVARAHEWQPLEGSTRRYELARMVRNQARSDAAPAPDREPVRASLELRTCLDGRAPDSISMKRGATGRLSAGKIQEMLHQSMERLPTIESLRAAGKVPPGTPPEAIARYARERAEYEQDMRAKLELTNVWNDHNERRIRVTAIVRVESDEPRPTYVRLMVPSRVGIELHGESHHVDNIDAPLPLTAPLEKGRKRFIARVHATRERFEGQYPAEKFAAPDGSNVAVLGPAPVSRESLMEFGFRFAFASWEDIAPFTLTYDISAEGMETVSGTIRMGTKVADA